jgi:hypothetical protein
MTSSEKNAKQVKQVKQSAIKYKYLHTNFAAKKKVP